MATTTTKLEPLQVPLHVVNHYFKALQGPLPSMLEGMSSQRWLLLYFSLVGQDLTRGTVQNKDSGDDSHTLPFEMGEGAAAVTDAILQCYDKASGGFLPLPDATIHIPSATGTHCALHCLKMCGSLETALENGDVVAQSVLDYVKTLHVVETEASTSTLRRRGAFSSSPGSLEADVRFTYSSLMTVSLIRSALPQEERCDDLTAFLATRCGIDADRIVEFVTSCQSYEGGFGGLPTLEAHGGMTYCATAALSLLGKLHAVDLHALRRYALARAASFDFEEIVPEEAFSFHPNPTGFQGRPNKDCDTCYTFWFGCTLHILGALDQVDGLPVAAFVAGNHCSHYGGICKNDGMVADPMHSCLGLSGLAALKSSGSLGGADTPPFPTLQGIDPVLGVSAAVAAGWSIPWQRGCI